MEDDLEKYVGRTVNLKIDGPAMIVTGVMPDGKKLVCVWFTGDRINAYEFFPSVLAGIND